MAIRPFQEHTPTISNACYIDPDATIIGKVHIGEHCSVWPQVSIRGDVNSITIGSHTNVQDGSVLHVTADSPYVPGGFPLVIGQYVTIGHNVVLHACEVGNYSLIGMGSTILDGAKIGDHCLIGAGSLVPPKKELESGHLWLGNPVKKVRVLNEKELEMLEWSAQHYVDLKNQYL